MYNLQASPSLGSLNASSLLGPGVAREVCMMRIYEVFVARYLLYVATSLLSALISSSDYGNASFSAHSIYLGSSNKNSKFKC